MNISWGMKYLLGDIDQKCQDTKEKTHFKSILLDSKPGRTKWNNPNRVGQDELYQGLEKVIIDLKSYTVRQVCVSVILDINRNHLSSQYPLSLILSLSL